NEYDHGALAIHDVASSRAVVGQVLQKYRDAGGNVVHVVHDTPEGAPLFTPGTELTEEWEELRPREGEEVSFSSFFCLIGKGAEDGIGLDAER
ncbi:MAG: hypothetical protein LQ341_006867, partial [Variospora aurantia]